MRGEGGRAGAAAQAGKGMHVRAHLSGTARDEGIG